MSNVVVPRKSAPVRLQFPHSGSSIAQADLEFRWLLPKAPPGVRYRLLVFAVRPGQTVAEAARGHPVYCAAGLRQTSFRIPEHEKALEFGKAYCWKIEARYDGKVLASDVAAFRRQRRAHLTPAGPVLAPPFDRSQFMAPAPYIWGHPVRLRPRSDVPGGEDGGGPTDPGWKCNVWGVEAGQLFLIEPYWSHARVAWDYSDVAGCEEVLLQIAGPDGFTEPNAADARGDPGVAAWWSCPVTIPDLCAGTFLTFQGDPIDVLYASDLNLQKTAEPHAFWDNLSVRLVPLDGAGNQIDVASDHVSVGCVDLPLISMETCNVEWTWGETPMRRIEFTIRLGRSFPTTGETAPSTLAIAGLTPHTGSSIAVAVQHNVRLLDGDGMSAGVAGHWREKPAYYVTIPQWTDGARLTFTLEQTPPAATADTGMLGHLIHFTDLHLLTHCIPGLTPGTYTCGQMLSEGDFRQIDCGDVFEGHFYDADLHGRDLFAGDIQSGMDPVFRLFTRQLFGTKHSVRTIDGVEDEDERDVTIEFRYVEEFEDAEDFELYLMRSTAADTESTITMVETVDGSATDWNFRMLGFHATISQGSEPSWHGPERTLPGRLILDPPNHLRMEFWRDRSRWDEGAERMIDDVEHVVYDVSH